MAVLTTPAARRAWTLLLLLLSLLAPASAGAARVGQTAPDFSLPDRVGRATSLAEQRESVVVVDFWASWCLPCAPMIPHLDALARRYAGRVRVLAVDIDQSRDKAEGFLQTYLPEPSSWMTILDDARAGTLARYGAAGMPAFYVLDATRTIRFVGVGFSPDHARELDDAVGALIGAEGSPGSPAPAPRAESASPVTTPPCAAIPTGSAAVP